KLAAGAGEASSRGLDVVAATVEDARSGLGRADRGQIATPSVALDTDPPDLGVVLATDLPDRLGLPAEDDLFVHRHALDRPDRLAVAKADSGTGSLWRRPSSAMWSSAGRSQTRHRPRYGHHHRQDRASSHSSSSSSQPRPG